MSLTLKILLGISIVIFVLAVYWAFVWICNNTAEWISRGGQMI